MTNKSIPAAWRRVRPELHSATGPEGSRLFASPSASYRTSFAKKWRRADGSGRLQGCGKTFDWSTAYYDQNTQCFYDDSLNVLYKVGFPTFESRAARAWERDEELAAMHATEETEEENPKPTAEDDEKHLSSGREEQSSQVENDEALTRRPSQRARRQRSLRRQQSPPRFRRLPQHEPRDYISDEDNGSCAPASALHATGMLRNDAQSDDDGWSSSASRDYSWERSVDAGELGSSLVRSRDPPHSRGLTNDDEEVRGPRASFTFGGAMSAHTLHLHLNLDVHPDLRRTNLEMWRETAACTLQRYFRRYLNETLAATTRTRLRGQLSVSSRRCAELHRLNRCLEKRMQEAERQLDILRASLRAEEAARGYRHPHVVHDEYRAVLLGCNYGIQY